MPFHNRVFINCPFDDEYRPMLEPVLFCLIYLEFEPSISQMDTAGISRIEQEWPLKKLFREKRLKRYMNGYLVFIRTYSGYDTITAWINKKWISGRN
jgi:hypothetical protein